MSIQNEQPIDPSTSDPKSGLDVKDTDFLERAEDITRQHIESRKTEGENGKTVVRIKIPRSMQEKVRSLSKSLGISRDLLLNSSIQYIICYSQTKNIEIRKLNGYSGNEENNDEYIECKVELSGKVFEELETQKLLSDVSKCSILGLKLLYLKLIELDKIG